MPSRYILGLYFRSRGLRLTIDVQKYVFRKAEQKLDQRLSFTAQDPQALKVVKAMVRIRLYYGRGFPDDGLDTQ